MNWTERLSAQKKGQVETSVSEKGIMKIQQKEKEASSFAHSHVTELSNHPKHLNKCSLPTYCL